MTQFYTPHLTDNSEYIVVDSSEFYHIIKTQRHKLSDIIKIFNGKGIKAEAKIDFIDKDKVGLKILKKEFLNKKKYNIEVILGIIKIDRFELTLEKLTEIGVTSITPVICTRVNVGLDSFTRRYERFNKIILEAAKQSECGFLPELLSVKKLQELFFEQKIDFLNIVLNKNSQKNFSDIMKQIKDSNNIRIFVGPEGDFSEEEIEFLKQQKKTFFINISENTLRSETAAIVSSSIVFYIKNC
ncbi:MAG: RsmE family RNA methyltransferase [Endomicrobiia bacterium]